MSPIDRVQGAVTDTPWNTPRILVAGARALFAGPGMRLSPHRLSVATVVLTLVHPFHLVLLESDETRVARIGLIPPDTRHHLRTEGRVLFLYLDALSDDHSAITPETLARLNTNIEGVTAPMDGASSISTETLLSMLTESLGLVAKRIPDPRIERVVRALDTAPEEFDAIEGAACRASLSVSHFQQLFREAVGTTFRRYRLWRRMSVVALGLSRGDSLTRAALDAGFSSSAHLSSTFREMFGLKPSELLKANARFVV
ncbi:MAG: helix-turn-helix transcriptional regulator [Myxococcota bacterium]